MDKKEWAAASAATLVKDGMVVGLGTGSTAELAIRKIGKRVKEEGLKILAVATSLQSALLAAECGITLTTLDEHFPLDICIDGADQVDSALNLLKGGWGSHTREKVVAAAAKRLVICVDDSKLVERLNKAVPLEVLPYARRVVFEAVQTLGGTPKLRTHAFAKGVAPFFTEHGNMIIDADFGEIEDPKELGAKLSEIPGVVEHGIFTLAKKTEVHVGRDGGVEILKPKR
ncbi:MAG: Ribose 5-phosphate isomerase [Candidatus Alkanophagales archaeon MCA70_species_1]|nr:Ribose 5-phosphate isomerase [Candidatus Alkanophaga volatiphilum]